MADVALAVERILGKDEVVGSNPAISTKGVRMKTFEELIGHRINGMFLANDGWTLIFRTTQGKWLRWDTENDCCNSVWFNHITGVECVGEGNVFDLIRGALVLDTEDKGWNDNRNGDEHGYEVIQDGFWTIRTDRGYIDIEVRNSHNGYYGGSVRHVEQTQLENLDLTEITSDF